MGPGSYKWLILACMSALMGIALIAALATSEPTPTLDPNAICRDHGKVQRVYLGATDEPVGVVCRDGTWRRK